MTTQDLIDALKKSNALHDGRIKRMRLFSDRERYVLRQALGDYHDKHKWQSGAAGMMDELEMINYHIRSGYWPKP